MVSARVVFLGTPEFAVPSLRALLEAPGVTVAGVITQPDRPAGRGRKLTPPPVKRLALESGLPLLQPERLRDNPEAARFLLRASPDVLAVAAFGQILPPDVFQAAPHGALNVHASLLPRHRGAAPIAHAILAGDRQTGVTIMKIDAGLDTGAMLAWRSLPIPPDASAGELEARLARLGADLLAETLFPYLNGRLTPRAQDESQATWAPRIRKEQARVDWSSPAGEIHNRVRAFNPWPGAFALFRGGPLKLWRSVVEPPEGEPGKSPGTVCGVRGDRILVACGNGSRLGLAQVQPPSRKRMSGLEFANGFGVAPGEALQ